MLCAAAAKWAPLYPTLQTAHITASDNPNQRSWSEEPHEARVQVGEALQVCLDMCVYFCEYMCVCVMMADVCVCVCVCVRVCVCGVTGEEIPLQ